jgi:hypothetical protein
LLNQTKSLKGRLTFMYCIADFVIALFVQVDDALLAQETPPTKDARAKLSASEIVTLGLLQVLKGKNQSAFYRWALMNLRHFFPRLPERTRLFRLLAKYQALADAFLAQATEVGYADSLGIELIHPRREGRSKQQVGKKGLSNHRWIVGIKFCPLLNAKGRIVDWEADTANVHDGTFQKFLRQWQTSCLSLYVDSGFHRSVKRGGDAPNLKICKRGENNLRMIIETVFSCWTETFAMKKITNRRWPSMEARLTYACAAYNLMADWAEGLSAQHKKNIGIAQIVCL